MEASSLRRFSVFFDRTTLSPTVVPIHSAYLLNHHDTAEIPYFGDILDDASEIVEAFVASTAPVILHHQMWRHQCGVNSLCC